jgi:hypothetical protein
MDDIKIFKEKMINDYIYNNINLAHTGTNDIKMGLKMVIGEEPAIKFNYKENMKINETSGKVERLQNELESIDIYYTYIGSDNLQHASHMKYVVS